MVYQTAGGALAIFLLVYSITSCSHAHPDMQDFYQPEVILTVGMPGTYGLISGVKYIAGYMCGVGAR